MCDSKVSILGVGLGLTEISQSRQAYSNLDSEEAISCNHNAELMRNLEVATKDMVPIPITQGGHVPDIPLSDGALISDDDNDSFISSDTESEGGFGDANANDNVSDGAIPNEGAQGPNFAVYGEGCHRSIRRYECK